MDKETKVNGKSMTDTMNNLYKNKQTAAEGAKKPPQTPASSSEKTNFAIDTKGDNKLLGCVSDFGCGLGEELTVFD